MTQVARIDDTGAKEFEAARLREAQARTRAAEAELKAFEEQAAKRKAADDVGAVNHNARFSVETIDNLMIAMVDKVASLIFGIIDKVTGWWRHQPWGDEATALEPAVRYKKLHDVY